MFLQRSLFVGRAFRQAPFSIYGKARMFGTADASPLEEFRRVMGIIPQTVTVITASAALPNESTVMLRGITASSFTSVSGAPPLISFTVRLPSRMATVLNHCQFFAVNLLSKSQVNAAVVFSNPKVDHQFENLAFSIDGKTGTPILDGNLGTILCERYRKVEAGENELWIGKVQTVLLSDPKRLEQGTLMYQNRTFKTFSGEPVPIPPKQK